MLNLFIQKKKKAPLHNFSRDTRSFNKKGTVNREQGTGRNDKFLVKSEKIVGLSPSPYAVRLWW